MNALNFRLIVSDFDGTLASKDGQVSWKNQQAISDYIRAGGIFTISSGRLPLAILPQARKLGLKGLLSCGQGSSLLDIESGEVLFEERLPLDATLTACRKMEELGLHILAFDLWEYYSNRDDEMLRHYENVAKAKGIAVTDRRLSDFLEEKQLAAYKLVALVDPQDNAAVFSKLGSMEIAGCDVTKSMDFLVEVVNKNQSKGKALTFLAAKYGIPMEKTIAVGDNYNDISMIEAAGLGVAVANAEQTLKARADYICEYSNDQSAVAEVIEKFGFLQA